MYQRIILQQAESFQSGPCEGYFVQWLRWFLGVTGIILAVASSQASTLSVPSQYPTIGAATAAAQFGDLIEVAAGTYYENIELSEPCVTLRGAGSDVTIIDGSSIKAPVITIQEVADVVVSGFTITNGRNGGIQIWDASPIIENNVISSNRRETSGAGIYVAGDSNPLIRRNEIAGNRHYQGVGHLGGYGGGIYYGGGDLGVIALNNISENDAWHSGGGLYVSGSSPLIYKNSITGNRADYVGGVYISSGSPVLMNNLIADNFWDYVANNSAGISVRSGSARIVNNTIVGNRNDGILISATSASPADVRNNMIVSNRVHGVSAWAPVDLEYNNVYGNGEGFGNEDYAGPFAQPGVGSISEDPQFGPGYTLTPESPAIDVGDPSILDADGSRSDMGYTGGILANLAGPTADFDFDGDVDVLDLAVWEAEFGFSIGATRAEGDSDLDNDVDGADFLRFQRVFGAGVTCEGTVATDGSAAVIVPEPCTLLLLVGFAACVRRHRHRSF